MVVRVLCAVLCFVLLVIGSSQTVRVETAFAQETPREFQEVEKLAAEQKYQAALDKTLEILKSAQASKNSRLATEAILKATQFQMGLHGYETSVRFLKEQAWPENPADRILLNLYYAHSLNIYQQSYGWEIGQREKTVSNDKVDLKAWTTKQIGDEISKAYNAALSQTAGLNEPNKAFVRTYLNLNNYPDGIRPTLRDTVVYLAVQHFANQLYWDPKEANEVYKLDFNKLANSPSRTHLPAVGVNDHSIQVLASWLGEHEEFHLKNSRPEAAMEARYVLFEMLNQSAAEAGDKATVTAALAEYQKKNKNLRWWSRGQALYADQLKATESPGRLIEARNQAILGRDAHPGSPGAGMCTTIIAQIERPDFVYITMSHDEAQKKSIGIYYRNTTKLHFRAYATKFDESLKENIRYGVSRFDQQQAKRLIESNAKPTVEWSVDLAPTKDFAQHRALVALPKLPFGSYIVVGSFQKDFVASGNVAIGTAVIVTNLVLQSQVVKSKEIEARVYDGNTGKPVKGAQVDLYSYTWEKPARLLKSAQTDAEGFAKLPESAPPKGEYWNYFLVARSKDAFALEAEGVSFYSNERSSRIVNGSLVYTDRSIYRPEQKIHFKVVGYRGNGEDGNFTVAPKNDKITMMLRDPNNQVVSQKTVSLNDFGTASGTFEIPAGRPLGNWVVASSNFSGSSYIKVEEYKRPTFEAEWKDADQALRLNKPAKFTGEARYYFGLPVSSGLVRWRVTRVEVVPWWWMYRGYWSFGRNREPQTVASGETKVGEDGKFQIAFTPEADERKAKNAQDLSYSFELTADITDDGGETRTASRQFRLGFVSIQASMTWNKEFFTEGQAIEVSSSRSDLNGTPKAGRATYAIKRIKQPNVTPLPAELPRDFSAPNYYYTEFLNAADLEKYATPDDRTRYRWETDFEWVNVVTVWPADEVVKRGEFNHSASGAASAKIEGLNEGLYRIEYESKDDFGAIYKTSRDFIVGQPKRFALKLPLVVVPESTNAVVGGKARVLIQSGLENQTLTLEKFRSGKMIERRDLPSDQAVYEFPVTKEDRGGFTLVVSGVRDFQRMRKEVSIYVPWTDKELKLEFATFRDRIRPGAKETFSVSVKSADGKEAVASEVLAYMFDRSLDLFASHNYPSVSSLYPSKTGAAAKQFTLGQNAGAQIFNSMPSIPSRPYFHGDSLISRSGYGIGGPGSRGRSFGYARDGMQAELAAPAPAAMADMAEGEVAAEPRAAVAQKAMAKEKKESSSRGEDKNRAEPQGAAAGGAPEQEVQVRTDFSETAFFAPHLTTNKNGVASIEFKVPDSVTSWRVFAHAITKDIRGGTVTKETQTVKELMIRPYTPRFLREGDAAEIKVQVNNASDKELSGQLTFDIEDTSTGKSVAKEFGLPDLNTKSFKVAKDGSTTVGFPIKAPKRIGTFAFRVIAKSGGFSDGELRPFPVLPSRMHLAQSRFVTLRNESKKVLEFKDLAANDDPTLLNEQMVVTVDGQLFYGVLQALPYLATYPYECTEQTMNRFLSTGIVSSVFKKYPAVEQMAKEFSKRQTKYEAFNDQDPNRKLTLEESPWLQTAQGGTQETNPLVNVLNGDHARAERDRAIAKLKKMQLPSGAFPWFEGGPADEYMTMYLLLGMSRALEFKVDVPKDMIVKAWKYTRSWLDRELEEMVRLNCCAEFVTLVNFAVSSYPDDSWTGNSFDATYRKRLLNYSFSHWKKHSPLLKGYLALTLKRMDRLSDAKLVWESVMDSAKHDDQLGTYWAQEDRSWLWYNDTIETHAFSLRVQMELDQQDKHNDGLVQWLFLNKKLNHWKSTKATAESIYALVHYLDKTGGLGQRESVTVDVGNRKTEFVFEPDKYTGKKNQIVIPGDKVDPKTTSKITVEKKSKGFAFASATWHFSTDRLPKEASGDFFNVTRRYFKREQNKAGQWELRALAEGAKLSVGDQVEVQVSLKTKHEAQYVHLRDPRAAGLEPEVLNSGYRWDLGIFWYEETRDSGSNFFFTKLPVGEYTFKYRLRANMAGDFRIGPATVQSMYAPEFNAYSQGHTMTIR